ncbi:unnamed protein product [Blumeria hordei]|uniref:Inositol polyphosphate-related phosphatase domain-containing protein n=1 Tax=Blumeria hordei TaxID=2867405 RepID=A0A383UN97_BLUHO|nr:unnamed protein product [Blumeria hordei]
MKSSINLYILSFNCGKHFLDTNSFSSQLFSSLVSPELPDLLVLSLQELAPLPHSFIGGSFLTPYLTRFYDAVHLAAERFPGSNAETFTPVASHNLGSTSIIIFAKDPSTIVDIESAEVGVGFWGLGNKGAAGLRLRYHDTMFTFIAAHLTAMEWNLQKRNEDWKKIVQRLVFHDDAQKGIGEKTPLLSKRLNSASIYKANSHLFVAGDLNYRTSINPPTKNDYSDTFPQPYFLINNTRHYMNLLKSDQLNQARLSGKTCQGLTEAEIKFPPTYKYDPKKQALLSDKKSPDFWYWAAHRWPSWCDRILYLDLPSWLGNIHTEASMKVLNYYTLPVTQTSDHQPVVLEIQVPLIAIPEPNYEMESSDPRIHPPYEIDPSWKSQRTLAKFLETFVGWPLWLLTTSEGGWLVFIVTVGLVLASLSLRSATFSLGR